MISIYKHNLITINYDMKNKLNSINYDFSIQTFKGGFDKNFSYILTCLSTGSEIIIDAAIELNKLQPFLKSKPSALLVTHSHYDHIKYIRSYIENFPNIKILGNPKSKINYASDRFISMNDNTTIKIGELKILNIHTPGHYFDSICYLVENVLFSGDTLFVGRTGRTISNGSNIDDLYDSVYNKLLRLPDDTYIYPGHDYGEVPSITIKENKKISDLLQAKNKEDFINKMVRYEKNRNIGS